MENISNRLVYSVLFSFCAFSIKIHICVFSDVFLVARREGRSSSRHAQSSTIGGTNKAFYKLKKKRKEWRPKQRHKYSWCIGEKKCRMTIDVSLVVNFVSTQCFRSIESNTSETYRRKTEYMEDYNMKLLALNSF